MEKSTFDDYFQNDKHGGNAGSGVMRGTVSRIYHNEHRVDVDLGPYDQPLIYIQYDSGEPSVGPNVGPHKLPRVGSPVKVSMDQGKSYGLSNGIAFGGGYTKGDFPAPSHPGIKDNPGVQAMQYPIAERDEISPGSIEYYDEKGARHTLLMAKGSYQSMGSNDQRDKGISLTDAEKKGLDAMNALAAVSNNAGKLAAGASALTNSAEGLQDMSQQFTQIGAGMDGGHRAMSSAGGAFGEQIKAQTDSMAMSANAGGLASGNPDFNSLR